MSRLARGLTLSVISAVAAGNLTAQPSYLADPLQHDIMSDEIFMDAAWHMKVEDVQETANGLTVTTTGAVFEFSLQESQVVCRQRLAKARPSLLVAFPNGSLAGLQITSQGSGAVILRSVAGVEFKVNCDSLLMIRSHDDVAVRCRILFEPIQTYSYGSDYSGPQKLDNRNGVP